LPVLLEIGNMMIKQTSEQPKIPSGTGTNNVDKYKDGEVTMGNKTIKTISFNSLLDDPSLLDKALRGK